MTDYKSARTLVMTLLRDKKKISPDDISEKVQIIRSMLEMSEPETDIDWKQLSREVESNCNVRIGRVTILENKEPDHKVWLPNLKSEIEWKFWDRYKRYLEEEKGWSNQITEGLGLITDDIIGRLENPKRNGSWDRRGMVVGQVQSGKTANYTGLICKAADSGYKLIIVLAGLHKSLRSQTQRRLDMEFLGVDSQIFRDSAGDRDNSRIGVGNLLGEELLMANSLTTSADNGDFKKTIAEGLGALRIGSDPLLLVVKKNKSVLKNLLHWATQVDGAMDENGVKKVSHVPLLIIDDEADNASINTKSTPLDENSKVIDEYDATAINGLIRQLLNSFDKTAYVGYTATPFGNIFIMPTVESKKYGDDLFPKNFIINLPVPSNYIGPSKLFGIDSDDSAGIKEEKGLPIIKCIDDFEIFMPVKHDKYHNPVILPDSLKEAVKCFIISCAARIARGHGKEHNSMLVHVTRYQDVQMKIYELVKEELEHLKRRIEFGDGNSSHNIMDELEDIWINDYTVATKETKNQMGDQLITELEWKDVKENLFDAINRIEMKLMNGSANDVLDYDEYQEGASFIAIGGDKLSRGLTLEGLMVSYYLRASRMYDTLMQMGRWFGYRPGYVDLCRLYTSEELVTWYRYITLASEELRNELDYMAALKSSPEDYGLKVRTHSDGLLITAVNKMRNGTPLELSYSGSAVENVVFSKDNLTVEHNFNVVSEFIRKRGHPDEQKKLNSVWKNVPSKDIIELLNEVHIHPDSRKMNVQLISDYIKAQMEIDELNMWTICLVSNSKANPPLYSVGGINVGLTIRQDKTDKTQKYTMPNGRLLSPSDELIDLDDKQIERARDMMYSETGKHRDIPSGRYVRKIRSVEKGLLLIYLLDHRIANTSKPVMGMALSFPESENARAVTYKVNNIYWEEEFGVSNN